MIKAALFDVFGTCVNWREGVTNFVRPYLIDRGLKSELAVQMADHWRALYDPSMALIRNGKRAYVTLDIIQRENLDSVLNNLNISHLFNEDARDELNQAWEQLPAWPDTRAALSKLKSRMPIVACSNGSKPMMKRLANHAGLAWSGICGADIGQNFKPHPDVYLKSCAILKTLPEETFMIACHADDLDAAASFGLKTGYFPRPTEWGNEPFKIEEKTNRFNFAAPRFSTLIAGILKNS